jgi:hypothetical protein
MENSSEQLSQDSRHGSRSSVNSALSNKHAEQRGSMPISKGTAVVHRQPRSGHAREVLPGIRKLKPGQGHRQQSNDDLFMAERDEEKLSIESTMEDFRAFQSGMVHPALVLDIMVQEDDTQKFTEFDSNFISPRLL